MEPARRFHRTLLLATLMTAAVAGCTFDVQSLPTEAALPATVWIETGTDGGLLATALPAVRGEQPATYALPLTPAWYEGPGVYAREGDAYQREIDGTGLSLDDVLMLDDAAPAAE